jgi:hypothetical protein
MAQRSTDQHDCCESRLLTAALCDMLIPIWAFSKIERKRLSLSCRASCERSRSVISSVKPTRYCGLPVSLTLDLVADLSLLATMTGRSPLLIRRLGRAWALSCWLFTAAAHAQACFSAGGLSEASSTINAPNGVLMRSFPNHCGWRVEVNGSGVGCRSELHSRAPGQQRGLFR